MTNTDANNKGSFDPGKSAFEFLKELIKTPYLYILSVGVFLIILGLAGNIPWVGKLPIWASLILIPFGGWLSFTAVQLHRKGNRDGDLRRKFNAVNLALVRETERSRNLSDSIKKVISLLEEKEHKDTADFHIMRVLHETTAEILQELQGSRNQTIAGDWFEGTLNRWIQKRLMDYLKELNYDFLSNRSKRRSFFSDVEKYLKLLSENLKKDVYRTPSVEGLTKSVNDLSVYVRVFQDLKAEIQFAMESDRDILGYSGIDYINRHFDAFIAFINE